LPAEPRSYSNIRLSPDGRRLVSSIFEEGNEDIWIYDLERDTSSRLTFDPASDDRPVWTPDGARVLFSSTRSDSGIFWKAADGTGQVEQLTTSVHPQRPETFSPDGTQMVYREEAEFPSDFHVLSIDGEFASETLLATVFDEDGSAISPDGRWISYNSNETGSREIYVRPFPNVEDGKWQISSDGGTDSSWNPDGSELFYLAADGPLMVVDIETSPTFSAGNPTVLINGDYVFLGSNFPSYSVSPDGERFLMLKDASDAAAVPNDIVVVQNWFEELERLVPTE
jgi:Tol biopolymer transport system component